MPLVSDVQVGTGATGASASISAALPASVLTGDMLMFIVVTENPQTVTTNPSGYGSPVYSDDTLGGAGIRIWAKIAGASESAPTAVYAASGNYAAIVCRVRGGATPSQFAAQTTGFPPTTPNIDPTTAGSLKFGLLYVDPAVGIVAQAWSGTGVTTLANVMAGVNGTNGSLSLAVKAEDTAGTLVGNQNWSASCAAVAFAVAGAVTGAGVQRWDGSTWQTATVKRWDGSAWQTANVKRWDGSAWQPP